MVRNPLYIISCPGSEDNPRWSPATAYANFHPDGHMLANDAAMQPDAACLLPGVNGNVAASQASRVPFYDMAQPALPGGEGERPVYDVAQPTGSGENAWYDVAQSLSERARYDMAQPTSREGEGTTYDVVQPALSAHREQYYDVARAESWV